MAKRLSNVTDTELQILQVLWENAKATIGEITEAIYPEKTAPQYATVQKLLERLEGKNCVSRDRSQRAHLFEATVNREQFIDNGLQTLADQLCGGSLTPLLTNLVSSDRISSEERQSLRNLIERLDKENLE